VDAQRAIGSSDRRITVRCRSATTTPSASASFVGLSMFRSAVGVKGLWHKSDGRHAKLRLTLTSGVVLDTELLKAGKTNSFEKGRSCQFLKFQIPSQGPGTIERLTSSKKGKKFWKRRIVASDKPERHEEGLHIGCAVVVLDPRTNPRPHDRLPRTCSTRVGRHARVCPNVRVTLRLQAWSHLPPPARIIIASHMSGKAF
jgi:hypothetical protein